MLLISALASEVNLLLIISLVIVFLGLILRRFNQPYIIAYILSGVILGPYGLAIVTDTEVAQSLGDIGLIILMFFIGMEISLPDFLKRWKVAFFGTGMQVIFSILLMYMLGSFLDWSINRVILLGFIISISSSAVVIKLVQDRSSSDTKTSDNVISILLTQDILIVPMIITLTLLGGQSLDIGQVTLQIIGGILIMIVMIYLIKKQRIKLPFEKVLSKDHELQIFAGLIACFGLALITSLFELSASLGALISGILINASDSNKWLHDSLHSFRVILISIFFISVGMLIDLTFLSEHIIAVSFLVLIVYLSNHGINTLSLRLLGNDWKESLLGGSFLAQIGEFSFVLATIGLQQGIITTYGYQITIIVIAITIFISPFWVSLTQLLIGKKS
ncbi:transporter, CPA2 family [Ekhidna lutea]|uniref:Transporter, CPA2 family n=1 Tax=Ekhidna lutea TaxID=447679 RepID=A0A239K4P2_EKHLU|nr:cation:proton antiporter [Ekhidna lutea]SNT13307.1 transporter, CPA2 family [Ekhidna lutea]